MNNAGVRNTHFKINQALEVLIDPRAWLLFSYAFLTMIANGPISSFVPIIISSFGFSTLNSLLLMMPFGFITGTIEWLAPFIASKLPGSRTWIMFVCQTGTTMSALLLWLLPSGATGGLLFGIYFLASLGGGYSILMGLQTVCGLSPRTESTRYV